LVTRKIHLFLNDQWLQKDAVKEYLDAEIIILFGN
jgi:hypothetical protein